MGEAGLKRSTIVTVCVSAVFTMVVSVAVVVMVRGQIDRGIGSGAMTEKYIQELDEMQSEFVSLTYKDKVYTDIKDLIGVVKEPEFNLDCKVKDAEGNIKTKKAYIIFSSDTAVKTVEYEDNGVVKITLPVADNDD